MQFVNQRLITPLSESTTKQLMVGNKILLSGKIYCGRDAVLPRICALVQEGKLSDYGIDLRGSVIFHSAVSAAGLGPTSSNKLEIENSMSELSAAGVKLHLGKGSISPETVRLLNDNNSVFAVIPPITTLLTENVISKKVIAFPELGMEAFYELEVKDYPAVIAVAHQKSIYNKEPI